MAAKRKKRGAVITVTAVVVVLALAAGALALRPKRANYEQVAAAAGNIETTYSFDGSVEAKNSQTVYADSVMQIKELYVAKGDTVKKDDVLMKTTAGQKIKAPADGTVAELDADVDEQKMAGATLCRIVDYSDLQLSVQVDEYDLPDVSVGGKAAVTVNALNKTLEGTVTDIAREGVTQNGVTYFYATVSLPSDSSLRVGMTAQAKVSGETAKNVTVLPMTAVQFDSANRPYVYVSSGKNEVRRVNLTVGINDGTNVEIKSGVRSGETVLVPSSTSSSSGFSVGTRHSQNAVTSSGGASSTAGGTGSRS